MHEDFYKCFLKWKEYWAKNSALNLHLEDISNPKIGYGTADGNFLSQQWAKQNNAYYFDVLDFLEAMHLKDKAKAISYMEQLSDKSKIITRELPLLTDDDQKILDPYWMDFLTALKGVWTDPSLAERRLVVPIHLMFGKIQHASVACFNFKPKQDAVDVIVLEQHAQKKGEPNYEADVDYTDGIKLHANVWSSIMHQKENGFLGIGTVNTFVNEKPICRRHNVCGVIASELARRLLEADDPMVLAKSGIMITNEEVDKLHARNQKLEAKYGHFPLMVIQKNGGRK